MTSVIIVNFRFIAQPYFRLSDRLFQAFHYTWGFQHVIVKTIFSPRLLAAGFRFQLCRWEPTATSRDMAIR